MIKENFFRFCTAVAVALLANAGICLSQSFSIRNVSYSVADSSVVVHYDLSGPASKSYRVQLVLRRKTQPSFRIMPVDVTGDVGIVHHPGPGKEIVWHLYKEIPYGLDGDDYYFEVLVSMVGGKESGASWLYYVGGAVVLGGAAAVYFGTNLFNKSGGKPPIPAPPLRPQ